MATTYTPDEAVENRKALVYSFFAYQRIVVRKHGLTPLYTESEVERMSDRSLSEAVEIVRELAHLPSAG